MVDLLSVLKKDDEFRRDWQNVLRIFEKHDIPRVVLEKIYEKQAFAGSADEVVKQAGIVQMRIDGGLAVFEFLENLLENDVIENIDITYSGEL